MKLSVAWIFDHIKADYKKIDINKLVKLFNETTAEIDSFRKIIVDLDNLFLATAKEVGSSSVLLDIPELKKEINLPLRSDLKNGDTFLIKRESDIFRWALSTDLGSEKEMILPSLNYSSDDLKGNWKKDFEKEDYILDIDNKSITNRPDLWGHRGFAREFSMLLKLDLNPEASLYENIEVKNSDTKAADNNLSVSIQDFSKCKRLAGLFVNEIDNLPSSIFLAQRLSKVDSKSINSIVDVTNYVMLDIGQPMHAFDAQKIENTLIARSAKNGEKLTVLDGDQVELISDDCVIASQKEVTSLAGIMGGQVSGINYSTKQVVLESGIFDSTVIRLTAARLKKRSEASARFEKALDINQNILAIKRFVKIFKDLGLKISFDSSILSVGKEAAQNIINLDHSFIEKRLGISVDSNYVIDGLSKLGFIIEFKDGSYKITVPSNRSTKDITIVEDIVEEVARIYGYSKIPYILPKKETLAHDISDVLRVRNIKNYMSFGARMMEAKTYPFYDESFLDKLEWHPENIIEVLNPVSQNWKVLVGSLIPNILKAVETNLYKAQSMRFYELSRVWKKIDKGSSAESKVLSGIIFEHKKELDFYECKSILNGLFQMLNIKVDWVKSGSSEFPWYDSSLSADILHEGKKIGVAGLIDKKLLSKIFDEGSAFAFEIDADFLIKFKSFDFKFKHLVKFPAVELDISMFVPLNLTVATLQSAILKANSLIKEVNLIDIFEKADWIDKKSLAFRFKVLNENKTLNKEEIEEVLNLVKSKLESLGADVR